MSCALNRKSPPFHTYPPVDSEQHRGRAPTAPDTPLFASLGRMWTNNANVAPLWSMCTHGELADIWDDRRGTCNGLIPAFQDAPPVLHANVFHAPKKFHPALATHSAALPDGATLTPNAHLTTQFPGRGQMAARAAAPSSPRPGQIMRKNGLQVTRLGMSPQIRDKCD
ncbi:unnamed protein product [Pleuronectes platessa]|uniref:Uncharacterized protein n=1 Tax=Pleuronectes platessa TaxID=8262 RepID=A0A9N7U8L6_PLEPL|nr:unnamed protein product [Pleuronectes platessa]